MITKKEDLYGTYVLNDHSGAIELYLNFINSFGISSKTMSIEKSALALEVCKQGDRWVALWIVNSLGALDSTSMKLTLSDLKPRTRTEYEKVTFNEDYEHLCRMIKGESFYDCRGEIEYKFNGYGFVCAQGFGEYQNAKWDSSRPSELYQKVEKEISKVQEIHDFIINSKSMRLDTNFNDILFVDGYFNDFLELCRVALRANGEIE